MSAIEVPAQTHPPAYVHNEIQVSAGTNWDFSRSAQATPIVALPDPVPVIATQPPGAPTVAAPVDRGVPALIVQFGANNAVVRKSEQRAIRALPHEQAWHVVAYLDSSESGALRIARARARTVAALLKASGHRVKGVETSAEENVVGAANSTVREVLLFQVSGD